MIGAIDRRVIYLLVLLGLSIPLLKNYSVRPAPIAAAANLYQLVEELPSANGRVALIALDYGPNLVAENGSQARVMIEHLMRRRIPVVLTALYAQAEPYLEALPQEIANRLMLEFPDQRWTYGTDWINLGYRVGGFQVLQSIAKSDNLANLLKKDARGNPLTELPIFSKVHTLKDIMLVGEFTGLVGMLDIYLQFLQTAEYRPPIVHGCTSITIPDAYIFLDSGQISGLLEGIAGAAWYSELLSKASPARAIDESRVLNTGLGVAHLVVIALMILGNLTMLWNRRRSE